MITDADKGAIAALTQKIVSSWAQHDADGFAEVFAEGGTMILEGVYCDSPDAVRAHMAEAFKGQYKGTQVTGKPISIRALSPDTAILLSEGGVLQAGETEVSERNAIRASWLAVRQADGGWLLAAYQNTPRFPVASAVQRAA